MVTPVLLDHSAQAKAHAGFDKNAFTIDWKARQVRCPAGKSSAHWNPVKQHGADAIVITFSVRTCRPCPFREQCTTSALGRRMLTLRPREPHEALVRGRAEQKTETWKAKYEEWRAPSTRPWTSPEYAGPATADCRKSASSTPSPPPH